ncbi:MAG: peptidylprolyl isomerase [Clostridiales bacterium]|nr:peptidylprolyl isomerase [Clostridiales bacterium]
MVKIRMADGGVIKAELYPEIAPISVENFIKLAGNGFYNGLTFHRVIPGFMIQGGCPEGTGTGGPGYTIKGEFASNGIRNDLKHTRGVLSMARAMAPDSAGSQFFIMHEDAPHLDGQYAAFGKVIEGMDVVDRIASVRTDYADKPLEPVVIEVMEVIL